MLQANFSVSPSSGYVLATQFTVTNLTTADSSVWRYNWDPGTGVLVYNKPTPTFTYNYPGTYTITLTAIDYNSNTSIFTQQVSADLAYRDYITFSQIPNSYANPGLPTNEPFEISVISSNPNSPLIVDLYAANSLSTPLEYVPSKWNFLTPTWYFTDVNSNIIKSLVVPPTPVYVNGVVVAVSGTAKFYYVDSMSTGNPTTNCPLLITATLQTSGFSNPNDSSVYAYPSYANNQSVRVGLTWQVNDITPSLLKVTGNYIDNINANQYVGVNIPTMITYHGNRSNILPGAEDSTSGILFSYPPSNDIGKQSSINLSLFGLPPEYITLEQYPLYSQSTDQNGNSISGYVFTSFTTPFPTPYFSSEYPQTYINAQTTVYSTDTITPGSYPYPREYVPNTSVWISNSEQNTLNKITVTPYPSSCDSLNYFKGLSALLDGYIKQVSVPPVTSTSTFNYNMSGFSGGYGIAIDPRDYSVVVADAEADYLYRFTNTGILTASYNLYNTDHYNPYQTTFIGQDFSITTSYLSSTSYYLYNLSTPSINSNNYIVTLNGVVQLPNTYSITKDNIFNFIVSDPTPIIPSTLNVTEIYNTSLPSNYISSIQYWLSSSPTPATTFPLTGSPTLSANTNYYVTSIDGIIQSPTTYTIDITNNNIVFSQPVPANVPVQVTFIPTLLNPQTQQYNFPYNTNKLSISGFTPFITDPYTTFFINVGGVFEGSLSYIVDVPNSQIILDSYVPANTDIFVTYTHTLSTVNQPRAYTPSSVSLDSNYNIWVSLFNDIYVLKFDPNFNLLFKTSPASLLGISDTATYSGDSKVTTDFYTEDFLLKPPTVETDRQNNCWATYSYSLCSLLVKYNSSGTPLTTITLPQYSSPTSLAVDINNNVWVSNSYITAATLGTIQLYNGTTYTLMSSITGIPRPGELSLNRNNNLWFTHSLRGIGYIDTKTGSVNLWYNDSSNGTILTTLTGNITNQSYTTSAVDVYLNDEEYSSLAVDVNDRLWYIDSYNNNVNILLSAVPQIINTSNSIRTIAAIPNNYTGYYTDPNSNSTQTLTTTAAYRSIQATGDWTGNKWYQKYGNVQKFATLSIAGTSVPFNVNNFSNPYQIKRVNESFNASQYYKSLALPENLNSNTVLFDQFFAGAVGTSYLSANQDIGQVTYERTANFLQNHSDIDTCLVDQILNLAETVDINPFTYSTSYPSDIKNTLDVASIPMHKLWGVQDNTPLMPASIGAQYNTLTDFVSAGTSIVLKSKFDSTTKIVQVPPLSGSNYYPLSSFIGYGFVQPVRTNYLIYQFTPVYSGNYVGNIIDWNTDQTTLSPTASTFQDWYGDNGIIESTFRYLLTKNLFLNN
jgi:PKD domain